MAADPAAPPSGPDAPASAPAPATADGQQHDQAIATAEGRGHDQAPAPATAPPRGWARLRWHLLGVFVIYHIAAVVLQALPDPGGAFSRQAWRDPTVQQEFAIWSRWLSANGYAITPRQLEDRLWVLAGDLAKVRRAVVRPFNLYGNVIGVRQPWRMFVAPHRFPTSLEIDVREDREWRTIYADRSDAHTWRRGLFDHDRMRAAVFRYGWPNYRGVYGEFALWIAREVARDFPQATDVRIRMLKRRTPSPEEVKESKIPAGTYQQDVILPLEGKR